MHATASLRYTKGVSGRPSKRLPKTDPSVAVGYLRVSTDDQHLGVDAQRAAIETWCAAKGCRVASWRTDHVSGGAALERRVALLEALDDLKEHAAGILIVAKRDRLARDVMVAAMVERLAERVGARVVSADGAGNQRGPEGELMRGLMDLFAQYERAIIRKRTTDALAVKRRRGERISRQLPLGYALGPDGKTLVADEREREVLRYVGALRAAGLSWGQLAARLNAEGIVGRGGPWSRATAARWVKAATSARETVQGGGG